MLLARPPRRASDIHVLSDTSLMPAWRATPVGPGLSVRRVTEFVREETASKKGCGRRAPMSAVRSFLRFLTWRGIVPAGLDRAIPRTRLAGHASLPRRLSADQITQLLDAASTGKTASRDRAILHLLARLGLRCAEVVALEIDDIDWRAGLLRVRIGKSPRERVLPLPHDVGTALADYIQHDRPSGLSRAVFFGVNDRTQPLRAPSRSRAWLSAISSVPTSHSAGSAAPICSATLRPVDW